MFASTTDVNGNSESIFVRNLIAVGTTSVAIAIRRNQFWWPAVLTQTKTQLISESAPGYAQVGVCLIEQTSNMNRGAFTRGNTFPRDSKLV